MIISLNGTVQSIDTHYLVLDVHDVGYMVYATTALLARIQVSNTLQLSIYHHIRDDSSQLFGFDTMDERRIFERLLSVSGIGPKVALGILSSMVIQDLVHAIQTKNIHLITQCQGIGKKTAERLVLDLTDSFNDLASITNHSAPISANPTGIDASNDDELLMALKQLGYQSEEIKRACLKQAAALANESSVENQLRLLLRHL